MIAVNDGVIKKMGTSKKLGKYIVLQDVYGNQYTYSGLGDLSRVYPVAKTSIPSGKTIAKALSAHVGQAGRQAAQAHRAGERRAPEARLIGQRQQLGEEERRSEGAQGEEAQAVRAVQRRRAPAATKERLFAHPSRPASKSAGGLEQIFDSQAHAAGFSTFQNYFSRRSA